VSILLQSLLVRVVLDVFADGSLGTVSSAGCGASPVRATTRPCGSRSRCRSSAASIADQRKRNLLHGRPDWESVSLSLRAVCCDNAASDGLLGNSHALICEPSSCAELMLQVLANDGVDR